MLAVFVRYVHDADMCRRKERRICGQNPVQNVVKRIKLLAVAVFCGLITPYGK